MNVNVVALADEKYTTLAQTISTEVDSLLLATGYGGGKLGTKDTAVWKKMQLDFETNLSDGIKAGRSLIMQRGWGLARIIHEQTEFSRHTNAPVWYKGRATNTLATTEALA